MKAPFVALFLGILFVSLRNHRARRARQKKCDLVNARHQAEIDATERDLEMIRRGER